MCPSMLSIESRQKDLYMINLLHIILIDLSWSKQRLRHRLKKILKILYCSILLHCSLNYDQFTVLCANICHFYKFTFNIFKIVKFLKVLKITTCFDQYDHPQLLKSSGGNCCYYAAIACVPSMRTCVVLGVSCSLLFSVAWTDRNWVKEIPSHSHEWSYIKAYTNYPEYHNIIARHAKTWNFYSS
jgi:hypothetical protein